MRPVMNSEGEVDVWQGIHGTGDGLLCMDRLMSIQALMLDAARTNEGELSICAAEEAVIEVADVELTMRGASAVKQRCDSRDTLDRL